MYYVYMYVCMYVCMCRCQQGNKKRELAAALSDLGVFKIIDIIGA